MKTVAFFAASFAAFALLAVPAVSAPTAEAQAALADKARPAEDVARDPLRKPAEMAAFAGLHRGSRVVDFIPGGGYFSMVFAGVVAPGGHVYAVVPKAAEAYMAKGTAQINAFAATHPTLSVVVNSGGFDMTVPGGPVDVVWTAQNYHDLYNPLPGSKGPGPSDLMPFNKAVFAALKPGGLYVIVDHVAAAGSGTSATNTLHRIDPAVIRKDVEAAGFTFAGESDVLRNPVDDHTKNVFDPSIRGKTDQVVLKFRKPG
jgi:predicted methyltransferase